MYDAVDLEGFESRSSLVGVTKRCQLRTYSYARTHRTYADAKFESMSICQQQTKLYVTVKTVDVTPLVFVGVTGFNCFCSTCRP